MLDKTFKDKKVISYLNNNFIPVRVNVEDKESHFINKTYNIFSIPESFFLSESSSIIGKRAGFIDVKQMLRILDIINKEKTS